MTTEEPILRNAPVALAGQCKRQYIELMEAIESDAALGTTIQGNITQQKTVLKAIRLRAGAIE
jgi:hypothetical protein